MNLKASNRNIAIILSSIILFSLIIVLTSYFFLQRREDKLIERYVNLQFKYNIKDKNKDDENIDKKFIDFMKQIESKFDRKNLKLKEKIIKRIDHTKREIIMLNLSSNSALQPQNLNNASFSIQKRAQQFFMPREIKFENCSLKIEGKMIDISQNNTIKLTDEANVSGEEGSKIFDFSYQHQYAINIYKGLLLLSKTKEYQENDVFSDFIQRYEFNLKTALEKNHFVSGDKTSLTLDFELMTKNDMVYYGLIPFLNDEIRPIYIDDISVGDNKEVEGKLKDLEKIYMKEGVNDRIGINSTEGTKAISI